jgi:hypothetical protein
VNGHATAALVPVKECAQGKLPFSKGPYVKPALLWATLKVKWRSSAGERRSSSGSRFRFMCHDLFFLPASLIALIWRIVTLSVPRRF